MTKKKGAGFWRYEQAEVLEEVRTKLPDGWEVQVYYVTSGDSGEKYLCQILTNGKTRQRIELCDCWNGKGKLPLSILGAIDHLCKHTENLVLFLQEKGKLK